jgi:hypothetical protein
MTPRAFGSKTCGSEVMVSAFLYVQDLVPP